MISGVVLCGGAGRRFGGRDKPLLMLGGQPMVGHVIERLSDQVDEVVISANRHRARYEALGGAVVEDPVPGLGPLGGVAAALPACRGALLFVCPGDAPELSTDLVGRLVERLEAAGEDTDAVIPHDGTRDQWLFLLIRRRAALTVVPYLEAGGRSVFGWLEGLSVTRCPVADDRSFVNVNTPEDLDALRSRWHSAGG